MFPRDERAEISTISLPLNDLLLNIVSTTLKFANLIKLLSYLKMKAGLCLKFCLI